jgi:hypothetical protein
VFTYADRLVILIPGLQDLATIVAAFSSSLLAGRSFGGFASAPAMALTAANVLNRIMALVDNATPVLIAGHSWGGATGELVAGHLATAQPERDVQAISFGSPMPSNQRLAAVARGREWVDYGRPDDPVFFWPNAFGGSDVFLAFLALFLWDSYLTFRHPGQTELLVVPGGFPEIAARLESFILAVIDVDLGDAEAELDGHSLAAYIAALAESAASDLDCRQLISDALAFAAGADPVGELTALPGCVGVLVAATALQTFETPDPDFFPTAVAGFREDGGQAWLAEFSWTLGNPIITSGFDRWRWHWSGTHWLLSFQRWDSPSVPEADPPTATLVDFPVGLDCGAVKLTATGIGTITLVFSAA